MHEYVQKSISTTLPRRDLVLSGGELSQETAPLMSGNGPSSSRVICGSAALAVKTAGLGWCTASISRCSAFAVFTKENFVNRFVSQPRAIAATPAITATPNARRIQTLNAKERFMADNALLPANRAIPNETAAPSANDNNKNEDRTPGPGIAAPVKIKPRIGPAQGAHSRPVEMPRSKDFPIPPSSPGAVCILLPARTKGRLNTSAIDGKSRLNPRTMKINIATNRPP